MKIEELEGVKKYLTNEYPYTSDFEFPTLNVIWTIKVDNGIRRYNETWEDNRRWMSNMQHKVWSC